MEIDPTRIAAQLLSGIGFLGAGTILRDGFSVKGLTTAASLLAVTCIGLIVGAGFYFGGIIATAMVYFVLTYSKVISEKVEHFNEFNLEIEVNNPKEIVEKIQEFLDKYKIEISEIKILENDDDKEYIKVAGQYRDKINKNKVMAGLMSMEDVKHVIEI
jgi:putative Mg2+ transporter-C (MgtC) family protein